MLTSIQPQANSAVKDKSSYSREDIKKVAREFEAMFAGIMLKAMNQSVERSSLVKKNMGETIFQEMLLDEYAKKMSEGKGLGLSELLYRTLSADEDKTNGIASKMREYKSSQYLSSAVTQREIGDTGINNIDAHIATAAEKHGVDKELIKAVIKQESGGNPYAVSKAGAKGIMQLMDSTAAEMGVRNSFNAADNINGGVKYLRKMLDLFNGDTKLALAAYNAGPNAVKQWNGVPPYPETMKYVDSIIRQTEGSMENNNE